MERYAKIAEYIIDLAKKNGAQESKVVIFECDSKTASLRNGEIGKTGRGITVSLSLVLWVDGKRAKVSGNDISPCSLEKFVCEAISIARESEAEECLSLAPVGLRPKNIRRKIALLDSEDRVKIPTIKEMTELLFGMDESARIFPEVFECESNFSYVRENFLFFTSDGFRVIIPSTMFSLSSVCYAKREGGQVSAFGYSDSACHFSDLLPLSLVGKTAAKRAVAHLGPRAMKSGTFPVVFDREGSYSFISHFLDAADGNAISGRYSFLEGLLHKRIFHESVTVTEDPLLPRNNSSCFFDTECTERKKINLVRDGYFTQYLTDLRSGYKIGVPTNGHANGVSAVYMHPGKETSEDLIRDIKYGVLVTDFMGHGPDISMADYSRGVSGFLIENGKISHPVEGVIVSGNLLDMFSRVRLANDVEIGRYNAPTIRIDGLVVTQ